MVRPGELRLAAWTEFDEKNIVCLIPAERMKGLGFGCVLFSFLRSKILRSR
jgi:hypothetical protein